MSIIVTDGLTPGFDPVAEAETLFREMADELTAEVHRLRKTKSGDLAAVRQNVRNLLTAMQLFNDERAKVDKLRKQTGGVAAGQSFDLDAARAEVGQRLACLRDAGGH